jgi:hypothetical protein
LQDAGATLQFCGRRSRRLNAAKHAYSQIQAVVNLWFNEAMF